MTFCGKCGYNNPEDRENCVNCGTSLKEAIGSSAPPEPQVHEVERIGSYNPDKSYPAPPMQPVNGYNQNQYGKQMNNMQPMPPMVPPMAQNMRSSQYNRSGRGFAIILSIAALAITIVSLFGIPLDFSSFDNTFLRVGMESADGVYLILTFVTLAIGIFALLEPLFAVVSGGCIIGLAAIAYGDAALAYFGTAELIVFVLLAVDIMVLGIVSMIFMRKFVNNNIKGVNAFKACYLTWAGIPHM